MGSRESLSLSSFHVRELRKHFVKKLSACAALGAMVSQLSVDEVADLLKNEGFKENVVKFFVKHEIDGEALLLLEKDHLNRIGSVKLGDILKFEKFISRLRESSTTEDAPALTGPSQTVRTQYLYLDFLYDCYLHCRGYLKKGKMNALVLPQTRVAE